MIMIDRELNYAFITTFHNIWFSIQEFIDEFFFASSSFNVREPLFLFLTRESET